MLDTKDGALLNDHIVAAACERHLRPMLGAYAEAEKQGPAALAAFNARMMAEAIACAARGDTK